MTTWQVTVDPAACIGSGMCAGAKPEVFELTGAAATVRTPGIDPDQDVLDVADQCPALAITVREGDTTLAP